MLDALELRRDPVTGEEVLVAGVDDPLYETAIPVGHSALSRAIRFSLATRLTADLLGPRALFRNVDPMRWRHRYSVGETGAGQRQPRGMWARPGSSLVALHLDTNGMLTSELLPGPRRPDFPEPAPLGRGSAGLDRERAPSMWATRAARPSQPTPRGTFLAPTRPRAEAWSSAT